MAHSALNNQWQQAVWPVMAPLAQQVAYLSGLGWKVDDIALELFMPGIAVTRIRETIRRQSTGVPCNYEPFSKMTSPAIDALTGIYRPSAQALVAYANLPDHQLQVLQKISDGLTMAGAGREVYGYDVETAQIENLITQTLGIRTRTQLQVFVMRAQNRPEAVDAPIAPPA